MGFLGMDIHEVDEPLCTMEPVVDNEEWRQSLTVGSLIDAQDSQGKTRHSLIFSHFSEFHLFVCS
jgi:hypothetical protein